MGGSLVRIDFRMDRDDYEEIAKIAQDEEITVSAFIRQTVKEKLSKVDRSHLDLVHSNELLLHELRELASEMRTCTQYSAATTVLVTSISSRMRHRQESGEDDDKYDERITKLMSNTTKKAFMNANNLSAAYESGQLAKREK